MKIRKPGYSIEHDSWFIPLTQGVIALVDGADVPVLAQHNWHADKAGRRWCAMRKVMNTVGKRTAALMHREIMNAPDGSDVDHIDHHPLDEKMVDNRCSNLRVCSRIENSRNMRPQRGGSSPFKGVSWYKRARKWQASIRIDGKPKYLGYFDCEETAGRAYDAAAEKHHGDFARTNKQMGLLS